MNLPTDPSVALAAAIRQMIAHPEPTPPAPRTERLLRAATVAVRLGCSKAHVYDLWESGKLPCVVLPSATAPTGRAKRIRESDLDAWIESLASPGRPVVIPVVPRRRSHR